MKLFKFLLFRVLKTSKNKYLLSHQKNNSKMEREGDFFFNTEKKTLDRA